MTGLPTTPSFRLDNKRALVTGAGRGLGAGMATALAQAGAEVMLAARSRDEIEALAQELRAAGHKASAMALDVTDLPAMQAALAAAPPFHVLVNNAGTN
ncbi:MAG: SDR family NAD(P)-dependent oxidoreductase, partial [Variibacter sp.]|nr:SDR family NAD(P)-dependent oxidoreductase [Variibacter sp.]